MQQSLNINKSIIRQFEKKYHRPENSVNLLAASKSRSLAQITELYDAGQRIFGENYLQEALAKMPLLMDKQIEWHFIGTIQRNKTRKIAEHFNWVQTIACDIIAKRLNEQRPLHLPPLNICIEVNISGTTSKSGIPPARALSLAQYCMTLPRLRLRGLMCIPEEQPDLTVQRHIFEQMYLLYKDLQQHGLPLDTLSMGMTEDMEAAIAEGTTLLRLGTALFGPRE